MPPEANIRALEHAAAPRRADGDARRRAPTPALSLRWLLGASFVLFAAGLAPVQAEAPYQLAPEPAWVDVVPTLAHETARGPGGLTYLLRDEQTDVGAEGWSEYFRIAYRIDARGLLEYGARFEVDFHPDYQRVEIHHVRLLRDDQTIERGGNIRAELMRREGELERDILDGGHTLNVLIPDVRVGDVVDFAYTVHGANPVFAGDYHDTFVATFSEPLARRRIRIRHPAARPLHWRLDTPLYTTEQSREGASALIVFEANNLAVNTTPEDAPSWYSAAGAIEVSTQADWPEVARWAVTKMTGRFTDARIAADMRAALELDGRASVATIERAVAFVQGEIRYTGLSLGAWTHTAYPPEETLARRYGDCKDKTALLVALLAEAGIEAWPVLVDTDRRATIATQLPSPLVFDHVIVQARFDGHDYWIDPTRAQEHGPLAARTPLPFGKGLPITLRSAGLVEIPWPRAELPDVDADQTIALSDEDGRKRAEFTVTTTYRGIEAERLIDQFESNAAAKIGEQYRDYMDKRYAGIELIGEPVISERAADGSVSVAEHYRWNMPEDGARYFAIDLFQIGDWLPAAGDQRAAPLALSGPRYGRQRVTVSHDGGWSIEAEDESNAADEFRFDRTVTVDGDSLVIDARWQRFSDAIAAERLASIREAVDQNWELQSFTLDFGSDGIDSSAWLAPGAWGWPLAAFAFSAVFVGVGYRRREGYLWGMLFAPRAAVARALDAPDTQQSVVGLLFFGAAVAMLFDQGAEFAAKPAAREFGAMVGGVFGGVLQSLFAVALAALGLRLVGRPARYGHLLIAHAWATVPALGLLLAAVIAIGGRLSLFADGSNAAPADLPALFTAIALVLAAAGWMMVALVNGYAQAAGATRLRALVGFLLGLALFVLMLALVANLFIYLESIR